MSAESGPPENAYRARSERGEVQIGTWITMIRTPSVLTLLQSAGLDYARLDLEHSAFSIETVADMATLARALDFPLVVRPPEGNREWITRLLDAGVWNLHVPQVESAEQAAAVVAATRYAPLGSRGMYGSGPHTAFRVRPPALHMAAANARVHVTAMLESADAFRRLDEIAAVPGIDMVHIGALDVSNVMGIPAQYADPRMRAVFEKVARACKAHGKSMGVGGARGDRELQRYLIDLGVRYLTSGSDVGYLMAAGKADVEAIRKIKA